MSVISISSQRAKKSRQRELAAETSPSEPLHGGWSSRVFFVFSALVHVAVAVALSGSWALGRSAGQAPSNAAASNPPRPAVARMAIDVGPIKFCEMKIEDIVGRGASQAAP